MVSDSSAAAGEAPFAARSERFTATSFQPTLAAGSELRKCTCSAIVSWVTTIRPSTATSSSNPRASGEVAIRRSRSITSRSRMPTPPASRRGEQEPSADARFLCDGIEQAVDETAFALVVKGVGAADIFGDDGADRHVRTSDQLIGSGAEDGSHRTVEALEGPALGQPGADQRIDL